MSSSSRIRSSASSTRLAVDRNDHVAGLDARLRRRRFLRHARHQRAAVLCAEVFRQLGRQRLDGHTEPPARAADERHQFVRQAVLETARFAVVAIAIVEAEVEVRRRHIEAESRACRVRLRAARDRRRGRSSSVIAAALRRRVRPSASCRPAATPIATVRPSGVSWTSRVNCRALRTRSPSYSTTTSPALMPGLLGRAVLVHFIDLHAAGGGLGIDVADHHAELAAAPVEHHHVAGRCAAAVRPERASGRSSSRPQSTMAASSPRQNTPNFRFFIASSSCPP